MNCLAIHGKSCDEHAVLAHTCPRTVPGSVALAPQRSILVEHPDKDDRSDKDVKGRPCRKELLLGVGRVASRRTNDRKVSLLFFFYASKPSCNREHPRGARGKVHALSDGLIEPRTPS